MAQTHYCNTCGQAPEGHIETMGDRHCDDCEATGQVRFIFGDGSCFRCDGKGYLDLGDVIRNGAADKRHDSQLTLPWD